MKNPVVEFEHVSRRFGRTLALSDVQLQIEPGRVHGLVGVNGAGKTTLIKHILGMLKAQTGHVRVFGRDPVANPVEVLGRIGYLSEERDLPAWMTIDELMRYTRAFFPKRDANYAGELLDTFRLDRSQKIKSLSRGMRAQTGLIAAVAHRPELLLLDEPSSGLDAIVRRDILDAIVRAVADDGRTVLFSSHLLDEIERMSDDVSMIHQGRLVLHGSVEEIRGRHQVLSLQLPQPREQWPAVDGLLHAEGSARSWRVTCNGDYENVQRSLSALGAEILDSRSASLQEIFVARVGRSALGSSERHSPSANE